MTNLTDSPESEQFVRLLESKALKYTHERRIILEEIQRTQGHFDADGLYAHLKETGLRIARDTVYRTIPLLLEGGIIQKSVGDGRREYFERTVGRGHHDHMVCIQCSKIIEFTSDEIEKAQEKICDQYGFRLKFHDHRLFGYCRECTLPV